MTARVVKTSRQFFAKVTCPGRSIVAMFASSSNLNMTDRLRGVESEMLSFTSLVGGRSPITVARPGPGEPLELVAGEWLTAVAGGLPAPGRRGVDGELAEADR